MIIQSVQNEKVKKWVKLHQKKGRDEAQQFLIEGEHLIKEALIINCVDTILILENTDCALPFSNIIECCQNVMNKISQNVSNAKIIAICNMIKIDVENKKRVLLLDNIQDPGNLGTIVRTAYSFGMDFIYCSEDCVDLYNDKVIRSTQGALFHMPIVKVNLIEICDKLKSEGFMIFGTALDNSIAFSESKDSEKVALVFGNEGQGVSQSLLMKTDGNFKIEMNDFDSLNVAVAAGICMYRYRK